MTVVTAAAIGMGLVVLFGAGALALAYYSAAHGKHARRK
ncbi:hypothetical protein SAMN05216241_101239 [Limimonas halophila]|uniref:Uncharacterized protein n=1 Tax=Limimonas halophila TaxID=1082479 RepID=A0A1G7LGH4_9PROT|nr:hypothetical protein SAMN05216241_101239 [Limimonas halophila]